ncbi:DUF342 domain-containing protein [Geobacter hydrogenophilus]|uniref:Flagellar Assembly Protein A N-terminal region domain-containing protein n=1 Tax=Geobacter hydrogenophilus TaxID=40983 RepID=A0A9W6FZ81_9BACT|nr:FapA family protein [Geobacter hydrogenophilus]MBT0893778.1 DUF342 domain-containing protein [Geobacter hydrogenophilus]GLI37524.1 hypothetical protein GHYDROH2_10250 [Geobacter hydrogenophilus]
MGESPSNPSGLTFRLADDRKLKAIYVPAAEKASVNLGFLRHALVAGGFADLFIYDHALVELIKRYNAATQEFVYDIGEQRDGTYIIRNTPDNIEAYLTLTRPYGGKPVRPEQLHQALKERGVIYGVLTDEIEAVMEAGEATDLLIARGIPPEQGTDAELVSLIPQARDRQPELQDNETVDYRDRGEISSVKAGDPLMRRIPPTPGKPGVNLMGKEVSAPPAKDLKFTPNLPGTAFAPDDPDLLIATIDGQPVLVANGVMIEPVIKVKTVDLSTGNISFKGSIDISGDIIPGMTVRATGDISVGGVVEGATLEAEGDIVVRGGIIGPGENRDPKGKSGQERALIRAKGNIEALFVENAHVEAGGMIQIAGFAMQSNLVAGTQVVVGQEGTTKGHIIGGSCQAVSRIQAVTLGSHAGVHTAVSVGVNPHVKEKLSTVKLKIAEAERELDELTKRLDYFASTPLKGTPEQINETRHAKEKLATALSELKGEKKRLEKRLEQAADALIRVERAVLSGVVISIGTKTLEVKDDMEGGITFRLEDDAIVASQ